METDKILVLNSGPAEHLCADLRQILEHSANLNVKVEQRSLLGTPDGGFFCGEISNAIANFRPRVIFLVLAGKNSDQVTAALTFLRAESMDIPIFAVLEASAPEEIMGLLQIGVEDFITPPLKPVDILPRLWRTLERTRPENPLTQALKAKLGLQQFVGESQAFLAIQRAEINLPGSCQTANPESFQRSKAKAVAEFETSFVRRLLEGHQGNITRAAQSAQKDRRVLRQLIHKHQIDVDQFKPTGR